MTIEKMRVIKETMKVAKAILIVADFKEMVTYLYAKEELGEITEQDVDRIIEFVTNECSTMTGAEADMIRNML